MYFYVYFQFPSNFVKSQFLPRKTRTACGVDVDPGEKDMGSNPEPLGVNYHCEFCTLAVEERSAFSC